MRGVVIIIVAFLAVSCASNRQPNNRNNPAVVFFGDFKGVDSHQSTKSPQASQQSQCPSSRASATAFEVGDELGVYLILDGQQFASANNRLDNGRFKVASDGTVKGDPTVYYPDPKAAVALYAYYPYISTINDVNKLTFSVQADQSSSENVKKSDLCYARQSVLPSAEAQRLLFAHKNGRLVLNFTNTTPSAIASVKLLDARTASTFNLQDGSNVTDAAVDGVNISLMAAVNTQAIVPAQSFAIDRPLLEVVLANGDRYMFKPQSQIAVNQGTQTTLLLSLDDNYTISLTAAPETEPWVSEATQAGLSGAVLNNFTVYWAFPGIGYKEAVRAELSVAQNDHTPKHTIEATNFKRVSVDEPLMCTYSFDFEVDPLILGYPYIIYMVSFFDAADGLIADCETVSAGGVYKPGDYTLGLEQNSILSVTQGRVNSYTDVFGSGDISGGVSNRFVFQLLEPAAAGYDYTQIKKIRMTADGVVFDFSGVSFTAGSNVLIAQTEVLDFAGNRPAGYPYTVQRVELLDGGGNVVGGVGIGVFQAEIMISRSGTVSVQLFRGKASELVQSTSFVAMGSGGSLDAPLFTGVVFDSSVELAFSLGSGAPPAGVSATAVTRADVTVRTGDGRSEVVRISPYVMLGTPLAANSSAALNIVRGAGWPSGAKFPYNITHVALYDKDGAVVVPTTQLSVPLEVSHSTKITLSVMVKSNFDVAVFPAGDWVSVPNVGGSRTVSVVTAGTDDWTAELTDNAGGALTVSPASGKVGQTASITWAAQEVVVSPTAAKPARSGKVTFKTKTGGGSLVVSTDQLAGVSWATGNLVANGANGAKIGAETDYGLTFQFGSLIGWNPTTTAAVAIAVRPSGYSGGTTWTTVGRYIGGTTANETIPATDAPTAGIGDACRYYLGGKWRTPTRVEYKTLFNNYVGGSSWLSSGASWQPTPAGAKHNNGLFFPAAGYRNYSDGSLNYVGSSGYYWSASVANAMTSYALNFDSTVISPQVNDYRTYGFLVRCVSE